MSASSTKNPTETESTQNNPPSTINTNVPPVVEDAVDAEDTLSTLLAATSAPTAGTRAPVAINLMATDNVPRVVTDAVLPNPVVLPNRVVDLALSTHRNGIRGLNNPAGVVYGSYQRRPTIPGLFDFAQKLHKVHFSEGCRKFFDGYDINPQRPACLCNSLDLQSKTVRLERRFLRYSRHTNGRFYKPRGNGI